MSVRLALVCSLVLASPLARAQQGGSMGFSAGPNGFNMNFNVQDDGQQQGQATMQVKASAHEEYSSSKPGETFKITYDSNNGGQTLFKVLAPESYGVRITDGGQELLRDTVPAAFNAQPGHFYRVEIFTSEAVFFDRKFEAKPGMLAQLWVTPNGRVSMPVAQQQPVQIQVQVQQPVAPPPQQAQVVVASAPASPCIGAGDLSDIRGAIESEGFSDGKLQVLGTALEGRQLCVAQVVTLIGLFDFSSDKIKALKMMAPRIADRQNNFKIYGAFDFDSDKQQAKAILR